MKEMLFGPVSPEIPASVLELHNDVTLIMDKIGAKQLLVELKKMGIV